jgi:fructokinase
VATLDTTGAGDAFMGAVHFRVKGKTRKELEDMPQPELTDIVDFANAAGSLATTHGGAIPAMPAMDEIRHCRQTTSFLRTQFV